MQPRNPIRFKFGPLCKTILCLLFFLLVTACAAQYPLNRETVKPEQKTQISRILEQDRSDLVMILAFSGGGTRAASLAYGTLEALRRVELPGKEPSGNTARPETKTLLDQVSVITSVSGGSFTAAYYGLHGEKTFTDFRDRFLVRDVQGELLVKFLNPFNWPRLGSLRFGRSDLAQEFYDEILFEGATLADMEGKDRPAVLMLATDAVEGVAFAFTRDTFRWICSDFDRFPVARAVAASSALPGPLSPIVLKNYAASCKHKISPWVQSALDDHDPMSRTYNMALRVSAYLDEVKKPYIYLADGGISDNLGIRAITDWVSIRGGLRNSLKQSNLKRPRRLAFIIVDAETEVKPSWGILGGEIPGIGTIMGVSTTIMINKYNFETLDLLRRTVGSWKSESEAMGSPTDFYIVHLTFNSLPEANERDYFHKIPTTLSLPANQVDRIREAAGRLLYSSPEFKRLVTDIKGQIAK